MMYNIKEYIKDIPVYEAGKPVELAVREYGIAEDEVVKLASNENPLGTPPKAQEAIMRYASKAHLYPDDSSYRLKDALSKRFGVQESNIIIGAGSDQVLSFISHIMLDSTKSILTSRVSFAMYDIYAKHNGAKVLKTPSFEHKADEFIDMIQKHNPSIVYICTPNNPTGDATAVDEVIKIIEASDRENSIVVVDGAYMEYAQAKDDSFYIDAKELISKYPNVVYLGTFSKAYGLGGLRVGYGIANSELISYLYRVRPPFNITNISMEAAIAALEDSEFIQKTLSTHLEELKRYEAFADENSIKYIDSYTNFITYLLPESISSTDIYRYLFERGVIVRDLASYKMNAIRITVGSKKQNDRLFETLKEAIEVN